jgi:cystathionine gamma-synthase
LLTIWIECYLEDDQQKVFELEDLDTLDDYIEKHESKNTTATDDNSNNTTQQTTTTGSIGFKNGRQARHLIWLESPKNPSCRLEDFELYVQKAKLIGAQVLVDSTFGTPVFQKPLLFGVDYVLHSCTKFLSGHSDILAGAIVTKSEDTHKKLQKERSVMGNVLGNLETWLLLRSIRTLEVRVNQQSKTAQEFAEWLEAQIDNEETNKRVTKVWYPTLQSNPEDRELCIKQMNGRGPGILSVELDTPENAQKLPTIVKLFTNATSLGGYESLMDYRYQWDTTVSPKLIRISIGLEHVNDLIKDMKKALLSL